MFGNMKKIGLFFFLLFFLGLKAQPIKVKSIISKNEIVTYNNQKLILIDFWATWCAPCYPATLQLEFLQEENKEKLFVASISDESKQKIEKFLVKRPIRLMILQDFNQFTFQQYNVLHRPFSVLINLEGEVIWKGHPSDLTKSNIEQFYRQNDHLKADFYSDIIQIGEEVKEEVISKYSISKLDLESSNDFIEETIENFYFQGDFSKLLAVFLEVSPLAIEFKTQDFKVSFKGNKKFIAENKEEIVTQILKQFSLQKNEYSKEDFVNELIVVDDSKLWDKNQINWSEGEDETSNYLLGSDRIQADNLTLQSFSNVLSEVKNEFYIYEGNDKIVHDWDVHYLHSNLMNEDLQENFGVEILGKFKSLKFIEITKKE